MTGPMLTLEGTRGGSNIPLRGTFIGDRLGPGHRRGGVYGLDIALRGDFGIERHFHIHIGEARHCRNAVAAGQGWIRVHKTSMLFPKKWKQWTLPLYLTDEATRGLF